MVPFKAEPGAATAPKVDFGAPAAPAAQPSANDNAPAAAPTPATGTN
jgi:hypothetical protein